MKVEGQCVSPVYERQVDFMTIQTPIFSRARCLVALFAFQVCLLFHPVAASAQDVGTYAHVEALALNLRTAPDAGSQVLLALPRGTTVSILDRRNGWARVFVQGVGSGGAQGWVAARFLGSGGAVTGQRRHRAHDGYEGGARRYGPLRVDMLDFDCRPPLFGNSGIRKCIASVRVRLPLDEFAPGRSDHVPVACRGAISYRTATEPYSKRLIEDERTSIAHNDQLGQSVRIHFPVRSERAKIESADLEAFTCWRD
ncbi:SH3 domain-containing protein [Aquibaculum arenosum]|uniref:SH3 domain-containing protein n=1 Tax=Aquibaculum arenosum TaxID=3032591 RepID=A0ABT5YRK1_9PROT|nr:SH3 domain-containing protein [Fodinicurvata sp. CAU 1616]MDF2097467.1 SH3 domain-containing protein [Fodinicurvata sp. CAU 1616]